MSVFVLRLGGPGGAEAFRFRGRRASATIARRSKRAAEPKKNKQDTKLGGLFTSDGKVHLYRVIAASVLAAKSDVAHFFLGEESANPSSSAALYTNLLCR